jgi:hypothetical protein
VSKARITIAVLALVAAVFCALLASDLRSWRDAVRTGDALFEQNPASATWQTSTVLPFDPARRILGISDQIEHRRAAQSFVHVNSLGRGFDNGREAARARAELESTLEGIARGPSRERNAAATNLFAILAYKDSQTTGVVKAASVDRPLAAWQSAVQLDPTNVDAKYNLEWLHRLLVAKGKRQGESEPGEGEDTGRKGAAGGRPNKGF